MKCKHCGHEPVGGEQATSVREVVGPGRRENSHHVPATPADLVDTIIATRVLTMEDDVFATMRSWPSKLSRAKAIALVEQWADAWLPPNLEQRIAEALVHIADEMHAEYSEFYIGDETKLAANIARVLKGETDA